MYHVLKHLSSLKLSVLLEVISKVVQTFSEELQEWKMKGGRKCFDF
jgi:hypothetical protein